MTEAFAQLINLNSELSSASHQEQWSGGRRNKGFENIAPISPLLFEFESAGSVDHLFCDVNDEQYTYPVFKDHQIYLPRCDKKMEELREGLKLSKGLWEQSFESLDLGRSRVNYAAIASEFQATQCRGLIAISNCLTYHWSVCTGGLVVTPDGMVTDREAMLPWLGIKEIRFECALKHIAEYAETYWTPSGVNGRSGISKRTISTRTDELRKMGLVDWVDVGWVDGFRKSRMWSRIDIVGLLLLAEACEQRLYELTTQEMNYSLYPEESPGLDFLPKHRGNTLRLLFNALFIGWGWRREGAQDTVTPTTSDESAKCQQESVVRGHKDWEVKREIEARLKRHAYFKDRNAPRFNYLAKKVWDEAISLGEMIGMTIEQIRKLIPPPITDEQLADLPF